MRSLYLLAGWTNSLLKSVLDAAHTCWKDKGVQIHTLHLDLVYVDSSDSSGDPGLQAVAELVQLTEETLEVLHLCLGKPDLFLPS